MTQKPSAVVISGSADLGMAAIDNWVNRGWSVTATFRRPSPKVEDLRRRGVRFEQLDLADGKAVTAFCKRRDEFGPWDVLMSCPATMEPVAAFLDCDFAEWEASVTLNFTRQMQALHAFLPTRRRGGEMPLVILWAGPGTNNAPLNYTAEIAAKIAQIKMCELLDAEIPDCRFVIVGPGWVKTKIHEETLRAGAAAGTNLKRTQQKMASNECTPIERVVEFLDWCQTQPKSVLGGRNFSVVHDIWGQPKLSAKLAATPDAFKLRRWLNDWKGDH